MDSLIIDQSEEQQKTRPGNIYDAFVKNIFGRILVFIDFLLYYADPQFVSNIEISKIDPAPTHYIGLTGDERITDLVFSCPLKNGTAQTRAIIVFEHIGDSLSELPIKLHSYASAIWKTEHKEGKELSALYFIVLRAGEKSLCGHYATLADLLPKDKNGQPIGIVPEIKYDVVDLPEIDLDQLRGSPVLRIGMGVLKKMTEGLEDEFAQALLPLLEIADEKQQTTITKEILDFASKVFAARNKRLRDEDIEKSLQPIFKERTKNMITTIFEEKYLEGE
ncbi:MAG: Rpn family recombination-promoting nuclease/putative transposase, partial [Planctomycetaceae bacterium]|nr:Rpn family recombination-promoting nuclease/putative transposase [Planctomycetaceae bacterium]